MQLSHPQARLYIPDQQAEAEALARTTHLGIGAHQDDLEFMAFHGILECYHRQDQWFAGVTCTDGAGSARTGPYEHFTNEEMMQARVQEQDMAALVGRYGSMIQLAHPSAAIKDPANPALKEDLRQILQATRPDFVYTHNPADKHASHIGVVMAVLRALRELPAEDRPKAVYGCEVWRGLDWMPDEDKVLHNVSGHENLAAALNGIFDSQIAGGKRYDLAIQGRRRANATFFDSHSVDNADMLIYAMDLTPLVQDPELDILEYTLGYIRKFEDDVRRQLSPYL